MDTCSGRRFRSHLFSFQDESLGADLVVLWRINFGHCGTNPENCSPLFLSNKIYAQRAKLEVWHGFIFLRIVIACNSLQARTVYAESLDTFKRLPYGDLGSSCSSSVDAVLFLH